MSSDWVDLEGKGKFRASEIAGVLVDHEDMQGNSGCGLVLKSGAVIVVPSDMYGVICAKLDPPLTVRTHRRILIQWSETTGWRNITDEDMQLWIDAYPACNVEQQIKAMDVWLRADPKRIKKRWMRFINAWLSRSQDRGSVNSAPRARNNPTDQPGTAANYARTLNEQETPF